MKDLRHLAIGDHVLTPGSDDWLQLKGQPSVAHQVYVITSVSQAQFKAKSITSPHVVTISKKNGLIGGRVHKKAQPATDQDVTNHRAQMSEYQRWLSAYKTVQPIWDKPLHKHGLSTEQIERLAQAWTEIKAMAIPEDSDGSSI